MPESQRCPDSGLQLHGSIPESRRLWCECGTITRIDAQGRVEDHEIGRQS